MPEEGISTCKLVALCCLFMLAGSATGQHARLFGTVTASTGEVLSFASVGVEGTEIGAVADEAGKFQFDSVPLGEHMVVASFLGFESERQRVQLKAGESVELDFMLAEAANTMDAVVVTGTLKASKRLDSPVPVEVYHPVFFRKNPSPSIFEALQQVNGVRPQLNCQVCNTGDIHINGLEGPYTMVLIDGMPIVSSLATVYGLSGIPNSLVERMEVVKGPASSLYGSEAIGGLINIITKVPGKAPVLSADLMGTTWGEWNVDLGAKLSLGTTASVLTGLNYFQFDQVVDNNGDNFTDVTLQERASVFQKWSFRRKCNRLFTLAGRYLWEDRWGGEVDWTPAHRGGDEIYGEAITTRRWEFLGQYQLPLLEQMLLSFSFNGHDQNSAYGNVPYLANQKIGFGQLTWSKQRQRHDLLLGAASRYTFFDDNTPATGGPASGQENNPDEIWLPGVFAQDEIGLARRHKLLLGMRYDYHPAHGHILTPRLAYKWSPSDNDIFRLNLGKGFRVVNLFTEDHAALTGAREVVIAEALRPEQSYNANLNFTKKIATKNGSSGSLEMSAWYTHFSNIILPDYETNPNQIIYDNLRGAAVSKGLSLNVDLTLPSGLSGSVGCSLMDVFKEEDGLRQRQVLTERFAAVWSLSYRFLSGKMLVDYTGNVYSPMRLPRLGVLDPRPAMSPWWTIQNLQLTFKGFRNFELYGGVKNLLNWTPWKNQREPLIARAFDPFDRGVQFNSEGNVLPTPDNPYALTFDPTYVYAPNQGIRGFLGVRYSFRKKVD